MEDQLDEERYCQKCWMKLPPDVAYCPICGRMAESIRVERSEPARPRILTIGPNMVFAAGLISLVGAFLNFGTVIGFFRYYLYGKDSWSYPLMPLVFLVLAVFGFVGFVCGRGAVSHSWSGESFGSTVAEIGFLAFVGLLNSIEGIVFWDALTGLSLFLTLVIGYPILVLSLSSLILISIV